LRPISRHAGGRGGILDRAADSLGAASGDQQLGIGRIDFDHFAGCGVEFAGGAGDHLYEHFASSKRNARPP
jgi:hypothetical protein